MERFPIEVTPLDIALDHEGRVIITNPSLAEQMSAALTDESSARAAQHHTNNNCGKGNCNYIAGCGAT